MNKTEIALANTVHWDPSEGDKVYMESLYLVITDFPFDTRRVILRFAKGPKLDLSIVDMDRLAIEYLTLRGAKLPTKVRDLLNAQPPPQCDFVVPGDLVSGLPKKKEPKSSPERSNPAKPKRQTGHS